MAFAPLKRFHAGSSCLSKAVKVFPVYQDPDVAGPAPADRDGGLSTSRPVRAPELGSG